MSSTPLKYYPVDEFDPKDFLSTYFCTKTDDALLEDVVINPMKDVLKELKSGRFYGGMLTDMSVGPSIFHLLTISKLFKEIAILEFNDSCVSELKKWLNKDGDAQDWSHASKILANLEGISVGWNLKEDLLRSKIKYILKCDLARDNPTDPVVLPKADCIFSAWALDVVSKTKEDYIRNLRKTSTLLKQGGRLILLGALNISYYTVGEHKFSVLTYDEKFLRKALKDGGYVIETFEARGRKTLTANLDYEKIVFVTAFKQ
ncbi:nicotinamide N-methyltransferase-like [Spea bombifrons]|uniref:nicotinamide N-methyltransferase-like n=1 Tax=Spea bombifrons TaxID=233779 RepID=UPI00234A0767|nr:nicotinamide N-methyltransferase-like [Spea bombifrons]